MGNTFYQVRKLTGFLQSMEWGSKAPNKMLSYLCLIKNPPSWMALLALLLLSSGYLLVGFGVFSIFYTFLVVFLSIVLYTLSNHMTVPVDKLMEEKFLVFEEESSDQREDIAPTRIPSNGTVTKTKEAEEVRDGVVNYSITTSTDLISESESQDQLSTSGDSEVDWLFQYNADQSPDCSEIALSSGHYMGQQKEEPKFKCSLQQKKQELLEESRFSQQSLIDFLAEFNDVNEEDNLIEIDISMGSIKYSRFEQKHEFALVF